jgi:hypothetical protein
MIGTSELSLEREPKTDERRTANDGPLSIVSLSRIVPGDGGGVAFGSGGVAALRGCRSLRSLRGRRGSLRSRGVRRCDEGSSRLLDYARPCRLAV